MILQLIRARLKDQASKTNQVLGWLWFEGLPLFLFGFAFGAIAALLRCLLGY